MEKFSTKDFNINNLEKKKDLEELLQIIQYSDNDKARLNNLKKLSKSDFGKYDVFSVLKYLALSDINNNIRSEAVKILYARYPEESVELIKYILLHDSNYNIPFINLTKRERYNFNDLIDISMERQINKEKMVKGIVGTDLTHVILKWKDCADQFKLFYEVNLNCFIAFHHQKQLLYYIFSSKYDPFLYFKLIKSIPISQIQEKSEPIIDFYETCFGYQSNLRISMIDHNDLDIKGKINDEIYNITIYFT
ncbi:MAG: HEAT repeat domain-containing protein [Candidatus Odinarchaeota archaeon]